MTSLDVSDPENKLKSLAFGSFCGSPRSWPIELNSMSDITVK